MVYCIIIGLMKNPKFTVTGKISLFKRHEDGTYFLMIVHRTQKGEYFSYPAKYKGELPKVLEKELMASPVIRGEGVLASVEKDGAIEIRLLLQSFDVLKPLVYQSAS